MADVVVLESRERVLAGILFTAAAYFLFSAQDASIKLLVAGMTVWQIMFFRSITVLVACGAIGGKRLFAATIASPIVRPMLVRSAFTLAAWLCYYNAARSLQLAELTTIYYAAPIIVTVLSVLVLGETVPLLRWIAVFIGFAGVFIACDPTRLGLSVPVILVLAAAVLWGIAVVLLRKTAMQERTMIQLVLNNFYFLLFSAVPALIWWRMPDGTQLLLLLSVGALGGVAQYMLFEGMKRAPVSIVAPFEYTSLVWAFALGYGIWGDVPRAEVFMGAALIIGAGLLVVGNERFRKREQAS
ncbi:DMT family transporter [Mesorhizobium sp. M2D.F.Ca.ET.185.01.1.1]|uniref:DMT family transporter n=1 Tax=unclassified Mesorhizobium TaxID=325217 RepID=UPI000FCCD1E2|nr:MULTISPECIES: DMT family transporter [unclassified Mesorhizobium]TGP57117.1 DMT family transporter [bacterium M00.F.Ca.ET.230.01.1.1]TGP76899.1 DMT family transporter [bacterium M00.F.Ca.ET.227.01.1.1]TGP84972.1 DMT family transporter [bacterium M00.F.Ca.ET.221.01.1.1]TGP88542.1 DMT family transporter [bacterium M00.F.Ca.ET.222.01.1.1]TGT68564.1 DMT family transporter [bacterium M00.F.Ca.ET.159.01.1.1]TGT80398.1 DMT family transporter [bacterium M00.F.Ca.ET.157.01.1.1]TGU04656.1 DMT famil